MRTFLILLVAFTTWLVNLLHLTVIPAPNSEKLSEKRLSESQFYSKEHYGLNHLVLVGSAFERGYASGKLTKNLIREGEELLWSEFHRFFPNPFGRFLFLIAIMRYSWGIEDFLSDAVREEVYGVSRFAEKKFDHVLDPLTRHLAYHAIHEVGQTFVDFQWENVGCTFFGLKSAEGWIVGRNFDFAVGRAFDLNKIVKWHFPDDGFAYLSVSWAGMTGTVTGVNEKGVYISYNAAGSSDFRRHGVPSTLLVNSALLQAENAAEAVRVIEEGSVFIADIYAVADPGHLFIVEKTPRRFFSREVLEPTVVANHFLHPDLIDDPLNQYRYENLSTKTRYLRGKELLADFSKTGASASETRVLDMLRDKRLPEGRESVFGDPRVIDSLIATHSVIFNTRTGIVFISEGPALVGKYRGYKLAESFRARKPIPDIDLPADSLIDRSAFQILDGKRQGRRL